MHHNIVGSAWLSRENVRLGTYHCQIRPDPTMVSSKSYIFLSNLLKVKHILVYSFYLLYEVRLYMYVHMPFVLLARLPLALIS